MNRKARPNKASKQSRERSPGDEPAVRRMGAIVNQLIARRGYAQVLVTDDMSRSLAQTMGSAVADCCRIGKLRAGVLQIYATDSVTLQELNFQKRYLIKQLQQDHPDSKITDVRFRIQSKS